jgi:hypothetical protein
MKPFILRHLVILSAAAVLVACGAQGDDENTGSSGAASLGSPGVANAADRGCNIVLRDISIPENRGGVDSSCTGTGLASCWVVLQGDLDISMTAVNEGDTPYVFYQAGSDATWYTSATATKIIGAGVGMQRYAFTLDHNTAIFDQPYPTIQVIPYLQTVAGTHLFDHNEFSGNYQLTSINNWSIHPDGTTCYDPPSPASASVIFSDGWQQTPSGIFGPGGKLDVSYDLDRMPQCFSASTDGVSAWNTEAYAYFTPGKQLISQSVKGALDPTTDKWTSSLFETDIPQDATSVALWFETSGEGCATSWDSAYGQNYNYAIAAP